MPRRAANVNQADVQRIIRACQRENVPFRVTLHPHGAAVFETIADVDAKPLVTSPTNSSGSAGKSPGVER
jgi:hypothetical protein